eukprot:COSAG01_NODE_25908_length_729_cov_2.774603_1_plen_73_part_10
MACTAAVGSAPTVPHHRRLLRAISCHVATAASVPPQLQALGDTIPRLWEHSIKDSSEVVAHSPWHDLPLFDRM